MMFNPADNAEYMLSIIQQMAVNNTNPVLICLAPFDDFIEQKKYNLTPIEGESISLRIFYHHHDFPGRHPAEHGHFHVFSRQNSHSDWRHLVAVSMDRQGQPVQLSMVNQWVTGSGWVTGSELTSLFSAIETLDPDSLLHSWFIALLCLLKQDIFELVAQRDLHLSNINENSPSGDILNNKSIYLLSSVDVNLEQRISQQLT